MRRTVAVLAIGTLLALAPAAGLADTETSVQRLEELAVQSANTPAEYQALAGYYRDKADDARQVAEHHRNMAKGYLGKPGQARNMREHCNEIVELNENLAAQYGKLAKAYEAQAGQ